MNGYRKGAYYGETQRAMYYNGATYYVVRDQGKYTHTTIYGGIGETTASIRLAWI